MFAMCFCGWPSVRDCLAPTGRRKYWKVQRVHLTKLRKPWPKELSEHWRSEVSLTFPNASVDDYHHIIGELTNDPKDRHVLATAIRSGAGVIVTYDLKDFPEGSLRPWGIDAVHPQDFLITL